MKILRWLLRPRFSHLDIIVMVLIWAEVVLHGPVWGLLLLPSLFAIVIFERAVGIRRDR